MTDFSELHRELLTAGYSQLAGFEICLTYFQLNNPLLKSGQCSARHF
jgi:hypothetical protein